MTEETKTVNIKELSDIELKALGYDQMAVLDQAQRFVNAINTELNSRIKPKEETKKK